MGPSFGTTCGKGLCKVRTASEQKNAAQPTDVSQCFVPKERTLTLTTIDSLDKKHVVMASDVWLTYPAAQWTHTPFSILRQPPHLLPAAQQEKTYDPPSKSPMGTSPGLHLILSWRAHSLLAVPSPKVI